MKKLQASETELVGSWIISNETVKEDHTCLRIKFLTTHVLDMIKTHTDGWSALYQDPNDNRFWELTYPESHMHGGGPESLTCLPSELAQKRYSLVD